MWGAQCLLEVRRRFWVGSGRPSMLMLVRSAAALATSNGRIFFCQVFGKKNLAPRAVGQSWFTPSHPLECRQGSETIARTRTGPAIWTPLRCLRLLP